MLFTRRTDKKSLPDMRPPFTIAYGGGELLCINLDTLGGDRELTAKKAAESEQYILAPSSPSLVLYALAQTVVDEETAAMLAQSIGRAKGGIKKLAFTGPGRRERRLLEKYLPPVALGNFYYKYFISVDEAKDWLVGRG